MTLTLTPVNHIPMILPGDNLAEIVSSALKEIGIRLRDQDILVFTQKIVSKAENRMVNLNEVEPSSRAMELSIIVGKDPRLVELILQESRSVLRASRGVLIVEHRIGIISANAGIDHSNVSGPHGSPGDWVLLLPEDPDASARRLRDEICQITSVSNVGLLIIDSHGRPWRMGTIGTTIGLAGLPGVVDLRGKRDIFGRKMQYTIVNAADELAAAASLVMGQLDEKIPLVHVRGFPYELRESSISELIRPESQDLFR